MLEISSELILSSLCPSILPLPELASPSVILSLLRSCLFLPVLHMGKMSPILLTYHSAFIIPSSARMQFCPTPSFGTYLALPLDLLVPPPANHLGPATMMTHLPVHRNSLGLRLTQIWIRIPALPLTEINDDRERIKTE